MFRTFGKYIVRVVAVLFSSYENTILFIPMIMLARSGLQAVVSPQSEFRGLGAQSELARSRKEENRGGGQQPTPASPCDGGNNHRRA